MRSDTYIKHNIDDVFIHYGDNQFDEKKFKDIKNYSSNKPIGGLWASPINCGRSWVDFCTDNEFMLEKLDKHFRFKLKSNSNVYVVDSHESAINMINKYEDIKENIFTYLNFEKMLSDGIQAVLFLMSKDRLLYFDFYGWDCDCILVLDKNIIDVL